MNCELWCWERLIDSFGEGIVGNWRQIDKGIRFMVHKRILFLMLKAKDTHIKSSFIRLILEAIGLSILFILFSIGISKAMDVTTNTVTSTNINNSRVFGCIACTVTNAPIRRTDILDSSSLPRLVLDTLPPDNEFGNGVPAGSTANDISLNTPISVSGVFSFSNNFNSTPSPLPNRTNRGSMSLDYTNTLQGGFTNQNMIFSMFFDISSMTDPDGNLIGDATGTFSQKIVQDGVTVTDKTGSFRFNMTDGFRLN